MKIIVCIDENNGMMFNNRRQSQDKILSDDIIKVTNGKKLYMNEYSYNLYKGKKYKNIIVCNDFLNKCSPDDFCLVENSSLVTYENKIDTIIIYNWNRNYPSDFKFDINIENNHWQLIKTEDFKGNSHDKITKNIYRRNNNEN